MSELVTVVKLDPEGHVVGHMRAPRPHGVWVEPPAHVKLDPEAHLMEPNGVWRKKTVAERRAFDERNRPKRVGVAAIDRLRVLRSGGLKTQKDRDEALSLLIDAYLGPDGA